MAAAQKNKTSGSFGSLEQMLKFRATAERHTTSPYNAIIPQTF
jgi:hypothetical protein